MANPSRTICFANGAAITADTEVISNIPELVTSAIGFVSVGTVTGTSPTLDIEIYQGIKTPTTTDTVGRDCLDNTYANYTWIPYAKLRQMTTSNTTQAFQLVGGSNVVGAAGASLALPTAGNINNGPIGAVWKVIFNVGGTNPSFGTVKCAVQFIP